MAQFTPPQFGMQQQQQDVRPRKQRGTGFTNIGQMLQANVGAGQQMGQKIGQTVGQQAGQVRTGVEKNVQQFQTGYEKARQEALKNISQVSGVAGQVGEKGEVQTGLSGLSEEEAKKLAEQFASTKYSGPMTIGGQLGQRAETLKGIAQQAASGQRGFFGETLAKGSPYTRGQSLLDQTLIGQNLQAQEAIRNASIEALKTSALAQQQEQTARGLASSTQELIGGKEGLKEKTLEDLIKSGERIKTAATEQAEEFKKDIERLKVLLPAKINELKTGLTQEGSLTEKDKQLISDFESGKYGNVEGIKEAYTGDEDAVKSALNTLIDNMAAPISGQYYTPEQQKAAQNLALIRKQEEEAKKIKESKYDTNVYKSGDTDAAEKGILSTTEKSREDKIKSVKNEYLNFAKNVINQNDFTPNLQKISPDLLNYVNKTMDGYAHTISGRKEMAAKIAEEVILPYLNQQLNEYDWAKDPRTSKTNLFDKIKENLGMKESTKNKIPIIFKLNDEIKNKINESAKKLSKKWQREQ